MVVISDCSVNLFLESVRYPFKYNCYKSCLCWLIFRGFVLLIYVPGCCPSMSLQSRFWEFVISARTYVPQACGALCAFIYTSCYRHLHFLCFYKMRTAVSPRHVHPMQLRRIQLTCDNVINSRSESSKDTIALVALCFNACNVKNSQPYSALKKSFVFNFTLSWIWFYIQCDPQNFKLYF